MEQIITSIAGMVVPNQRDMELILKYGFGHWIGAYLIKAVFGLLIFWFLFYILKIEVRIGRRKKKNP